MRRLESEYFGVETSPKLKHGKVVQGLRMINMYRDRMRTCNIVHNCSSEWAEHIIKRVLDACQVFGNHC